MKEANTTTAFTRCFSASVMVLMATTLGVAVVPDRNRDLSSGAGGSIAMELSDAPLAWADASALQPDGRVIAAGARVMTGSDSAFRLVRYNQDGSLDTTFGTAGKITTDFSEGADSAAAVAIQSDGKIIAAGAAGFTLGRQGYSFALVRYNRDGSLDTDFGIGGKVITDLSSPSEMAAALAIQSDGAIIAAGSARTGALSTSGDFALVRYHPDGSLDRTFGIDGQVITDWSGVLDTARALAIQSDGKIVVAGTGHVIDHRRPPWYGVVVRYNQDGSVDTTFGVRGKVTTDALGSSDIGALAIQSNGKIIAGGGSQSSGSSLDFGLVRYNGDGSMDTTFGAAGSVTTPFGPWRDRVFALSLQPDGKIVAGGDTESAEHGRSAYALARYNRDGSLDTNFGLGGKVRTDLPAGHLAYLRSVGIQRDGTIVAVGSRGLENDWVSVFELARYDAAGLLLRTSQ
jgi:uncharacterized delta-60 repeat protein